MRKFIIHALCYISAIVLFSIAFSITVDPYNIFHYNDMRIHSGSSNSNYVKTKYILDNPEKFNSFIFGSSRVGYIHVEQLNSDEQRWYNMTYPNGTLPEIKETIKTFVQHGIIPKTIMIGIDAIDGNDCYVHQDDLMRKPYPTTLKDKINFYLSYLNPSVSFESLFTLTWSSPENSLSTKEAFYEYGGIYTSGEKKYSWKNVEYRYTQPASQLSNGALDSLEVVKEIKSICEQNNINLILFTTPLHVSSYLLSMEQSFPMYICEIAKIHDIYCFSSINEINTNNANYWEEIHFDSNVGDLVIQCIFSPEDYNEELLSQGFGCKLTKNNADGHYQFLLEQYNNAKLQGF